MIDSSVRLCDLKYWIDKMAPIQIYINNILAWSDDVDITNMSEDEARIALLKNETIYNYVINKQDLVSNISFEIVSFHHSIVRIKLC